MAINAEDKPTEEAVLDVMRSIQRQERYRLKKKYFVGVPANEVRTTSPVSTMDDAQWRALVVHWSDPKNMVWVSAHIIFIHIYFPEHITLTHLTCSLPCRKQVIITSTVVPK